MVEMGFGAPCVTRALTATSWDSQKALRLLLTGLDSPDGDHGQIAASQERSKRYTARNVSRPAACGPDAFTQYLQRAHDKFPGAAFRVVDLGMAAGGHTNACFWLCLAASWSAVVPDAFWQAAPLQLRALAEQVAQVKAQPTDALCRSCRPQAGRDAVGLLAHALRSYFCGAGGVMHSPEEVVLLFPAFAALAPGRAAQTVETYRTVSESTSNIAFSCLRIRRLSHDDRGQCCVKAKL